MTVNYATITTALQTQLNGQAGVTSLLKLKKVTRGQFVNVDADNAPWAGIYRGKISYQPRTLGSDNNWEAFPSIRIVLQTASMLSGDACEDSLEALVKAVQDAILTDTTIGGTVDIVTSFDVDYQYRENERPTMHFQQAILTVNFEVATQ